MGTDYNWIEVTVRRKGGLDHVHGQGAFEQQFSGNRRTRQIAKRHWLRRREYGWEDCGGRSWDQATTKHPKGKILKCPKPR